MAEHVENSAVTSVASSKAGVGLAGPGCFGCAWIVIDEQQSVAEFSREAEQITRLSARQVLHQPVEVLPANLRGVIKEAFSTGKSIRARQIALPVTDEGGITVRLSTIAVRTTNGKCVAVIAMMSDPGSAEKLEQTTRRLQRLVGVGMLSTSMAHEIKNALVAVKTFLDLLLEKNRDAELAEIVGREMGRIDSLVSQMLRFAGPSRPALAAMHIHELLDQSLRMIEHQLEGKLISLRRIYAASPDIVKGNQQQLQQAFLNLFLNAADAMGPNGELSITTELVPAGTANSGPKRAKNQPKVRIVIKDTGAGIAPENMNRLFEPFFTTKNNGTGLGLSITRDIIQEHSGIITAESQVDQGTTFHILIPLVDRVD
jgi:two-component system, NtrC family, sensor histidine kinase HydH